MARSLQLLILLSISYLATAQNYTNETTTPEPFDTSTTMLYTTTTAYPTTADPTTADPTTDQPTTKYPTTAYPTTDEPTRTLEPSLEPTPSPVPAPSPSPTDATNIWTDNSDNNNNDAYLQEADVTCIGSTPGAITCGKVEGAQYDFWVTAAKDVTCTGSTNDDDCIVSIGGCVDIPSPATRRRLLETSNIIGVTITYKIVLRDAALVTAHEQRVNDGEFVNEFSEIVNDEYDDVEVDVEFQEATIGDADEFLGNEDPTFGEIIASPYIFLGTVCNLVGIIWLLFLRSNIDNKYPSYLSQPASAPSMSGNAVEMVPQTSGPDGGQKQKNKQELQQAWNESDAE